MESGSLLGCTPVLATACTKAVCDIFCKNNEFPPGTRFHTACCHFSPIVLVVGKNFSGFIVGIGDVCVSVRVCISGGGASLIHFIS